MALAVGWTWFKLLIVGVSAHFAFCRCLAYRQQDRVDVLTAAADPFLKLKRLRRESNIGS